MKWLRAIIAYFTKTKEKQPVQPELPVQPQLPAEPVKPIKGMLTREEYVDLNIRIFTGDVKVSPYNDYSYDELRETNGNNRSKGIDALIKRQGGDLGNAYCQFGQQDKMDALAQYLKIPRKNWNYPEGGSTQSVFNKVDAKYKRETPIAGSFWTVQYNGEHKGHIEDVAEVLQDGKSVMNLAFNTSIDGDDRVVRDGAGAGVAIRPVFKTKHQGSDTVVTRGFVDHYLIYQDAFKKVNAV